MPAPKLIFFEPAWKIRKTSYIEALFQSPPEGYSFASSNILQQQAWSFLSKYGLSFDIQALLSDFFPLPLIKGYLEKSKRLPKDVVLTYALDHCVLREEPWLLEMTFELPFILSGSERQLRVFSKKIEGILNGDNCKRIVSQLQIGINALVYQFPNIASEKLELIPRGATPRFFSKKYEKRKLTILFVNSANISSDISFYLKGGPEVVEAYLRLRKQYDNIQLILRTVMPKSFKDRLVGMKDIIIIDQPVPWSELETIWRSSDIFVHPHYTTPSYALLDAMSFGLPILATDMWGMNELVIDGREGFVIHSSLIKRFSEGPLAHILDPAFKTAVVREPKPDVVDGLVKGISILIEDVGLRKRMGEAGRLETLYGRHSILRRNEKLKQILDYIT